MSHSDKLLEARFGLLWDKIEQDISLSEARQSLPRLTGQWPGNIGATFGINSKNGGMPGIGRGEIALALTIAGVQNINMTTFAAPLTAEEKDTSPKRVTEINGVQGPGASFDVQVSKGSAGKIAKAIKAGGGTIGTNPIPITGGKRIEVKEPAVMKSTGAREFRMAAEGQGFIMSSKVYRNLISLASNLGGYVEDVNAVRTRSKKRGIGSAELPILQALGIAPEAAAVFIETMDSKGSAHEVKLAAAMLARGEGPEGALQADAAGRLKIHLMKKFVESMKAIASLSLDDIRQEGKKQNLTVDVLVSAVKIAQDYDADLTGSRALFNRVYKDPAKYLSSWTDLSQLIVDDAKGVSLFGTTPYLALVNASGYDLIPANTSYLLGRGGNPPVITLKGITQGGRPRWSVNLPSIQTSGYDRGNAVINEELFDLRVNLLVEELTRSDKKDIQRMIAKQMEADRSEQKKQAQKQFEAELKKVLGKDLMGGPAKINKAIQEIAKEQLKKELRGSDLKNAMAEVTKLVMKKLYRELAYSYTPVIDRIKI